MQSACIDGQSIQSKHYCSLPEMAVLCNFLTGMDRITMTSRYVLLQSIPVFFPLLQMLEDDIDCELLLFIQAAYTWWVG